MKTGKEKWMLVFGPAQKQANVQLGPEALVGTTRITMKRKRTMTEKKRIKLLQSKVTDLEVENKRLKRELTLGESRRIRAKANIHIQR